MNIVRFSVENRVPVNLLLLIMIAGGVIGYQAMPREVFPTVSIDRVAITTVFSGVSPEEIEKEITIPIEKELKGLKGIAHLTSSSIEGLSVIEVEIEEGHELKNVSQDIRSRIDQMDDLPSETEDPVVVEIEFEAPIVIVGVSGLVQEAVLRQISKNIEHQIGEIEGVGSVTLGGYRDREIWIELDPNRMYALGIGIQEVIQRLQTRNIDLSAGHLKGRREEVLVKTVGKFQHISEIDRIVIRKHPQGRHITLRDVGQVRLAFEEEKAQDRINGERAITLNVTKSPNGDAISIMEGIDQIVEKMRSTLPRGVEVSLTQNSAIWIKSRLKTLYINGIIGFSLVCLTLFTFLDWRMAFWTAVGIPASFLGAMFLMSFMGQTINMLSLFALILVLGLVVDDAIIVTENVYRHLNMGYSPVEAAIRGTRQVFLPVIATVSTTVAAFIPMMMMSGILGKFMKVIPIVVSLVLMMSLLEALLILPSHLADFSHSTPKKQPKSLGSGKWLVRFQRIYQKGLLFSLRYRYSVVTAAIFMTLALIGGAFFFQKFVLFGVKDIPGFVVMIETPGGSRLAETSRKVAEVERLAAALPEGDVNAVVSLIGRQLDPETGRIKLGSHLGQVYVELSSFDVPNRRNGYESLQEMREKVAEMLGLKSLKLEPIEGGPPVGAAVEVKIRGEDLDELRLISSEMRNYLEGIPGVYDIRDDYARGKKVLQFQVDPAKAALFGLNTASISRALRASLHGEEVSHVRWGDESIAMIIKFAEPYRHDYRYIEQIKIKNEKGVLVPIKNVTVLHLHEGVSSVNRKDHRRTVTVLAEVDTDVVTSGAVVKMIDERFGDLSQLHPGYHYAFGGETEEQRKSVGSLFRAYAMTVLIIYMILGGLFKSFLQPFIVMFAVPFGMIGVIIGHFVMNHELSLLSLIGVVALSGVVVNNSLLLVEFINRAREKGIHRWRSILISGRVRMRPILLTTMTTILGLLVLSFQTKGQAGYLAPMAISIVWGLLFSTALTLFLVPAFFAIADDLLLGLGRFRQQK